MEDDGREKGWGDGDSETQRHRDERGKGMEPGAQDRRRVREGERTVKAPSESREAIVQARGRRR